MQTLGTLGRFAGRQVRRVVSPLTQHRHQKPARGYTRRLAHARVANAWWADNPRWYPLDTPPRQRNDVTPLIDGEAFFTALHTAIAESQDYIYVVGWCLTPHIPLMRRDDQDLRASQLLVALSEAACRVPVRVLLWSGALVLLEPTRRTMREVAATIASEGRGDLVCTLDTSGGSHHCHHQKAIVVDGQIAFVGGMDLTTFQGDRWDTPRHAMRSGPNWHDVQLLLRGEVVADVERNFRQRWQATAGDGDLPHRAPVCQAGWETPVQVVRTIRARTYPFARRGEYGIYHAYVNALRRARRFIYLENQYIWSPDIMDVLLDGLLGDWDERMRAVVLLPAYAYSGKWDNDRSVMRLREADRGRGLIAFYCPYTSGPSVGKRAFAYHPIYVHAKVAIVDDEWCTVGSANLNNRGFILDSEMNAAVCAPDVARDLRVALWAEHLAMPRAEIERVDPTARLSTLGGARGGERADHGGRGPPARLCGLPLRDRTATRCVAAAGGRGADLRSLTGRDQSHGGIRRAMVGLAPHSAQPPS